MLVNRTLGASVETLILPGGETIVTEMGVPFEWPVEYEDLLTGDPRFTEA